MRYNLIKLLRFFRSDSDLVGIMCNDERYITCTSVLYHQLNYVIVVGDSLLRDK